MTRKFLFMFCVVLACLDVSSPTCNEDFLIDAIKALKKSIYYLGSHEKELILDAALGFRTTIDQLNLANERAPKHQISDDIIERMIFIEELANEYATVAAETAKSKNPKYWSFLGHIGEPGMYRLTHSGNFVNRDLINNNPLSCNEQYLVYGLGSVSDACLAATNKNFYINTTDECRLPDFCLGNLSFTGYKGYPLTHQLLGLALAETNKCLKDLDKFTDKGIDNLRDILVANVLRDAEAVQKANYPVVLRDLFLEHILVGGMFGYVDFLKRDWLDKILKWQNPNGGFYKSASYVCTDDWKELYNSTTRMKRNELILNDGGSMHFTSVAMNALTALLRLCVDEMPLKA